MPANESGAAIYISVISHAVKWDEYSSSCLIYFNQKITSALGWLIRKTVSKNDPREVLNTTLEQFTVSIE
ncbi:MAG: hypothetical protein DHS20C06_01320 [Hyphobacterium sp.]|nr:MAG: hypothetical protein DHS20C06_01320 [Hyphobacterium sp.]